MNLFKKYKQRGKSADEQEAAKKMIVKWLCLKSKISLYLQRKTEHYSLSTKKRAFVMFCLLFGGVSAGLIITAFDHDNVLNLFSIHRIKFSLNEDQSNKNQLNNEMIISNEEYRHFQQFKQKMDSLQLSSDGKILYDSIMQARPHLMDSINLIENLYQSQLNK
ncbi:MAG: hypothetical protein ACR2FN_00060 [Chitinophagaceae bacterium]